MRQSSDLAAKVVAGVGTTLLTAIGVAKFSDVWPYPPGSWPAVLLLIAGFAGMGFAVITFAIRIWKLHEPIALRSDTSLITGVPELNDVMSLFDEVATMNGVSSLLAYEARAHRLERIAKWLPSTDAPRVIEEADLIQTEVLATLARARVRILRSRIAEALRGRDAIKLYITFGVAVLAFGLAADWLQSERTDKVAVAKACADARAVSTVVEDKIPPICGKPRSNSEEPTTLTQELAKVNEELSAAFVDCLALAKNDTECDPIRAAMDVILPP